MSNHQTTGWSRRRHVVPTPVQGKRFSPYQWAVLLLLIITVSRVHSAFHWLMVLRPNLLLAGAAIVAAFLRPGQFDLRPMLKTPPLRIVFAIAVIALLSAPFGISLGASARFIIDNYSRILTFAVFLAAAIITGRDLRRYVWGYVIACAILVWMAFFVFGLSRAANSYVERLSNLYTYDSNDLGVVLVVGLPMAALLAQVSRGYTRILALLAAVGMGAAIARTGSRGGFVGVAIVGLALLIVVKGVSIPKRIAFVAVASISLVIASPPGYWEQMGTVMQPTADYNWSAKNGRREIAMRGLGYMMRYPFFGLGVSNFERAEGTISSKAINHEPGTALHWTAPHNTYLQIGAELGVVAGGLWLWLVLGSIFYLLRLRKRIPARWADGGLEERFLYFTPTYLSISFLGFAITSAFVSFAYMDIPYIIAMFAGGTMVALQRGLTREGLPAAVTAKRTRVRHPGGKPSTRR